MTTGTDAENAVREGENTPEVQEEQEVVPAWAQKLGDTVTRLESQQQSLKRQLQNADRRGEAPSPILLNTMANVEQMLAESQLETKIRGLDLTDEAAAAFRKLHNERTRAASPKDWTEEELNDKADAEFKSELLPDFMREAEMLGIELTPEGQQEIKQLFDKFPLHFNSATGRWSNLGEFKELIGTKLVKTAEQLQSGGKSPAEKAGRAMGEGGRPGGAPVPKKPDFLTTAWDDLYDYAVAQDKKARKS